MTPTRGAEKLQGQEPPPWSGEERTAPSMEGEPVISDREFAEGCLLIHALRLQSRASVGESVAIGQSFRAELESALREAARRLASSPTQGEGWRDIASAPKDGTLVLLAFDYHPRAVGRYEYGNWLYWPAVTEGGDSPTKWMPFPALENSDG